LVALVVGLGGRAWAQAVAAPVAAYDDKRWALVIGVGKYEELGGALQELRGPGNDARMVSDVLIQKGRFNPDHVIVLADGAEFPPTRDNIMAKLYEVSRNAKDGMLLFFFAGHGVAVGSEAYLLPSSVRGVDQPGSPFFKDTAIPVTAIRQYIGEGTVREVVVMVDACRNNPSAPAPRARSVGRGAAPVQNTEAFHQAFNWKNSVTIFSTQAGMEAFESGGDPSRGYFAETLAQALRGDYREAIDYDGAVSVNGLMGFLPGAVSHRVSVALPGKTQQPESMANISSRIVLTYPGAAGASSQPDARLRLNLPKAAVFQPGLMVARNKTLLTPASLTAPIAVNPGKQFVEVKLPGYEPWSGAVDIVQGEGRLDVQLQPRRWPMIASIAGAGVGVAAIVTGIAFGVRAGNLEGEISHACGGGPCDWAGTYQEKYRDMQHASALSTGFLIGGGVATAAGAAIATYLWWRRPVLKPEASFDIAAGPTHTGLGVVRTW
jgi:hypothetical protein